MNNETLNQVFSNTANSIRAKTGSQASITPINFANSILNIPTTSYDDIYRINTSENIYNIPNPKNEDICVIVSESTMSTLEYHTIKELSPISRLQLLESFTLPENYTKPSAVYPTDPKEQWVNTVFRGTISSSSLNFVIYKDNTAYIKVKLGSTEDYSIVYNYISTDGLHFTLTDKVIPELAEEYIDLETNTIDTSKLNYTITKSSDINRFTPAVGYMLRVAISKYVSDIMKYENNWSTVMGDGKVVSSIDDLQNISVKNNMFLIVQNGSYVDGLYTCHVLGDNKSATYARMNTSINSNMLYKTQRAYTSNGMVYGNFFNTGHEGTTLEILRWYISSLPNYVNNLTNCSGLFANQTNVTNITQVPLYEYTPLENLHPVDASKMFLRCYNLTSIDTFDVANIVNAKQMFQECRNIATLPSFNFSNKLEDTSHMFVMCNNLTSVPNFDTSSVTNTYMMFGYCYSLNISQIPNYNMSNCIDVGGMFYYCQKGNNIPMSDFPLVERAGSMFHGCTNITNVALNMPNLKHASHMFSGCTKLNYIGNRNIFSAPNIQDAAYMFFGCTNLFPPALSYTNIVNASYMFANSSSVGLSGVVFNNAIDCSYMWSSTTSLSSVYNLWFPNAENVAGMFAGTRFYYANNLRIPNATDVSYLFNNCKSLTSFHNINAVFPSNVPTNAYGMFFDCINLVNAPVLNTHSWVTFTAMFYNCANLVNVPYYDPTGVGGYCRDMYGKCNKLSDASLSNILRMCINIPASTGSSQNLANVGINASIYANRIMNLPEYSDFVNSGWIIG